MPRGQLRIALYSHDAMGIGHMRRNLLIADSLVGLTATPSVLLISGAKEAAAFRIPSGVDRVTLPAFRKHANGVYESRSLAVSAATLRDLRSRIVRAAVDAFEPDVFVVDKVPRGILNELDETLAQLRSHGRTRCVLGLRDILDAPAAVRQEWDGSGNEETIRTFYDAVWVYGDPAVYDPVSEYALAPHTAEKLAFTGYLDPSGRVSGETARGRAADRLPPGRMVLCQVGGGEDGERLADSFSRAAFPEGAHGVLLPGPFLPGAVRRRIARRAAKRPDFRMLGFRSQPGGLLRRAERIVAMGGYNTLCEVVSHEKSALVVPRVTPRQEQLIRAQRFSALGLVDLLHPDAATPEALSAWFARDLDPPRGVRERIDFGGLLRLPGLLEDVLEGQRSSVASLAARRGREEERRVSQATRRGREEERRVSRVARREREERRVS